jgi:nitroimidazol reductase NimA-like FMN-containing flavoprotein (pyridoxamine 5'-phosphate oxidase superfamily)
MARDKAIRDITQTDELIDIIQRCKVCHVGFSDNNIPYVLGFNFGFANNTIYLHCAKEGHKLDILNRNPEVCVFFDTDHDLFSRNEEVACSWRMRYKSVMAWGRAEIVTGYEEKLEGLEIFMKQYSDRKFSFSRPSVDNVNVIKIPVQKMTGRKFEYL